MQKILDNFKEGFASGMLKNKTKKTKKKRQSEILKTFGKKALVDMFGDDYENYIEDFNNNNRSKNGNLQTR